jgi:hypothetical protein
MLRLCAQHVDGKYSNNTHESGHVYVSVFVKTIVSELLERVGRVIVDYEIKYVIGQCQLIAP